MPAYVKAQITTIGKNHRRSRLADDGYTTEFCVATQRLLSPEFEARCCRHTLLVGDVVTLLVDLRGEKSGGGGGRLKIEVRSRAASEAAVVFDAEIPLVPTGKGAARRGGAKMAYSVVAAARQSNLALRFL